MQKIIAQSTPIGKSAIAVLRMSGDGCKDTLKKYFFPFPLHPNELRHGTLKLNGICDSAMLVFFDPPKSYTGEEMVELHLHGGIALVREVLESLLDDGFKMAKNGEFTKRAFVNGKTNLCKAEGLIDLIDAESEAALKAASALSQNKLGKKIDFLQQELTDALARIEATLDYPEENLEQSQMPIVIKTVQEVDECLKQLLSSASDGKTAKFGINIVLCGKPNTGKSSLLNALVGYERAIVSEQSGTTRDTVEETVDFKGLRMVFVDTAGLTDTNDNIERQGVNRAKQAMLKADLVLFVTDTDQTPDGYETFDCAKLLIRTKSDLCKNTQSFPHCVDNTDSGCAFVVPINDGAEFCHADNDRQNCGCLPDLYVSSVLNLNITELKQLIYDKFNGDKIFAADILLTSIRHTELLKEAHALLSSVLTPQFKDTADIVASQIRSAWSALGQVTGKTDADIVVDAIFSKFCLGK